MSRNGTAVVTGASRGLGLALLEAAATRCDGLVAIGRTPVAPEVLARLPGPVAQIDADLANDVHDWLPRLRALPEIMAARELIFFDNAAVHELAPAADPAFPALLGRALSVNVLAPAAIATALLQIARETGATLTIAHMTTGAARRPFQAWGGYCTSKAAAAALWDVIALENPGVRVRKIDPGALDTGMQAGIRNGPDVPGRDYFRELKDKQALLSPAVAAARVLAQLDA